MKIIGLSDIHGRLPDKHFLSILDHGDVVLLVGDITNFGRKKEAGLILDPIMERSPRVFAVSGNCDFPEVDAFLDEKQINLHASVKLLDGLGFAGLGGSLTTPFGTPNEYTEEQIAQALDQARENIPDETPFVLVSHQPPFQTACDRIASGVHVGSRSVRQFIERHQPLVCFTGHIHESFGMDRIGNTHVINTGHFGKGGYAFAEITPLEAVVEIRRWH